MLGLALAHKAVLLAVLFVGNTFDTSSELLLEYPWSRLLVWDAVHYAFLVQHGMPLYEHQYAFYSWWPRLVRLLSPADLRVVAVIMFGLALACHLGAVFVLRRWTGPALGATLSDASAASLAYILHPAGIFLVAGYPESTFALLSFAGLALFYRGKPVLAGLVFALSCQFRANGLIWGLLYAYEVSTGLWKHRIKGLIPFIIGGALIGGAFVGPQVLAYQAVCPGRPWCQWRIPSIYSWVQGHYWNVGFLRYWSLAQVPNFLFAAPTLLLLWRSRHAVHGGLRVAQMALLIGALFFWNVQIVTRVASCLPGPSIYVGQLWNSRHKTEARLWLTYFTVWGIVQASLFGAFLPPA